jgi:hypothetical protein
MTTPSYTIVTADSEQELIEKVTDLMASDQGWMPLGSASVSLHIDKEEIHHHFFCQSLICTPCKTEEEQ